MRSPLPALLIAAALAAGCVSPGARRAVPRGAVVEASGPAGEREYVLDKVRGNAPGSTPMARDKAELTAPADIDCDVSSGTLAVLGQEVRITTETEFEGLDRQPQPRFAIAAGDWLRVKVRSRDDGPPLARLVRRVEPRERFSVEGAVTETDPAGAWLSIGGVRLAPPEGASVAAVSKIEPAPGADLDDGGDGATDDPLALWREDERKGVPFTVRPLPSLALGGQISGGIRYEDNRDLDRDVRDDRERRQGELQIDALWAFGRGGSFAHVEGKAIVRETNRDGRHDETEARLELSRAYAYLAPADALRLQVGRQDFDEEREWLYDEVLDGLRVHLRTRPVEVEGSVSYGRELLDRKDETDGILNVIGLGRYWPGWLDGSHRLTGYVLAREDLEDRDFTLFLYGVRSYSRPRRGLRHWVELARADGKDHDVRIGGWAVDVGLSQAFDASLRPTITGGLAYATGSSDPADQRGAFRQSGLQDNNAKFGGVKSLRYYGEVVDPELSNLLVTTAGAGVRPLGGFSVDLVFHTLHQARAATDLRTTRLRRSPNGDSRYLGWEVDAVLAYRIIDRFNVSLVLGRFEPGAAFDEDDPTHLAELEVRLKF